MPKNGATPNFVEFKDQNNNVVASISTEGDLNVVGSIKINGEPVGTGAYRTTGTTDIPLGPGNGFVTVVFLTDTTETALVVGDNVKGQMIYTVGGETTSVSATTDSLDYENWGGGELIFDTSPDDLTVYVGQDITATSTGGAIAQGQVTSIGVNSITAACYPGGPALSLFVTDWTLVRTSSLPANGINPSVRFEGQITSIDPGVSYTVSANVIGVWESQESTIGMFGPVGPVGAAGANGADGPPGADGAAGANGLDGLSGLDGVNGVDGLGYAFEEIAGGPPVTPILVSGLTVGDALTLDGRVGAYKVGDLVKVTEPGKDPKELYIIGRVTSLNVTGDYSESLDIEVVNFKFGVETLIGEDARYSVSIVGEAGPGYVIGAQIGSSFDPESGWNFETSSAGAFAVGDYVRVVEDSENYILGFITQVVLFSESYYIYVNPDTTVGDPGFSPSFSVHLVGQGSAGGGFSLELKTYAIGDTGPAGGFVFLTPESPGNTTGKYFEVSPIDGEGYKYWALNYDFTSVDGADGTDIGTGYQNTLDIILQGNEDVRLYAAPYCNSAVIGGYSDWFLPSKEELEAVYTNLFLENLGDFNENDTFWTSSEFSSSHVWYVSFVNGYTDIDTLNKYTQLKVRPVRSFDPSPNIGDTLEFDGTNWVNVPRQTTLYKVGDIGPGGGIIFFVDRYNEYPDFTYLEVATIDFHVQLTWSSGFYDDETETSNYVVVPNAYHRGLGGGFQNTIEIVLAATADDETVNAAKYCDTLELGGKSDWYLPSISEARLISKVLYYDFFSSTAMDVYTPNLWSSTQINDQAAWVMFGDNRNFFSKDSLDNIYVAPMRRF